MDEKYAKLLNSINENLKVIIANQAILFCQVRAIEDEIQTENSRIQSVPKLRSDEKAS